MRRHPSENIIVGNPFGEARDRIPAREVEAAGGHRGAAGRDAAQSSPISLLVAGSSVVKIAVPSWRTDVHGKADIVEEIVRIVGVDKVPMTPFERGEEPRKPVLTAIQLRTRRAKRRSLRAAWWRP